METTLARPTILIRDSWLHGEAERIVRDFRPRSDFGKFVASLSHLLPAHQWAELVERVSRIVVIESQLELIHHRWDDLHGGFVLDDYGIVGRKSVTDAGVAAIVDAFDAGVGFTLNTFNYHALGTGTTAESAAQTALVTELTTEYTGNTRTAGTQSQPSANIYKSQATSTLDSGTPVLREHGLMSAASVGTLFDRTLFAAVTVDGTIGESITTPYSATFTSGG